MKLLSSNAGSWLFRAFVVLGVFTPSFAHALEATFASPATVAVTENHYKARGPLNVVLKFAPAPGTNLTVVENAGAEPISGTFAGLPQGGIVTATYQGRPYPFVVNYFGGKGNDLVLLWPFTAISSWGDNSSGQLAAARKAAEAKTPIPVGSGKDALAGKTIVATAGGRYHSLALTSEGRVYSWGDNSFGELGDGGTLLQSDSPVPVEVDGALAGKTIVAIAASGFHNLALSSQGQVFAWGGNEQGELGDGTTERRYSPVALANSGAMAGKTVVAIAAGDYHNVALTADGQVLSWGSNSDGELGIGGSESQITTPALVATSNSPMAGKTVVAVAAGYLHSIALSSDGQLFAWGGNDSGQLGDGGRKEKSATPLLVQTGGLPQGKTIKRIAAGAFHNMALTSDGQVIAWGDNSTGQLGDGTTINRPSPAVISGAGALAGKAVVSIAAAELHSMAVTPDGQLFAWGANTCGELGDGTRTQRNSPVAVATAAGSALEGNPVRFTAMGKNHSLAVFAVPASPLWPLEKSAIASTGNTSGQIAVPTPSPEPVASQTPSPEPTPASIVAAASTPTLALTSTRGTTVSIPTTPTPAKSAMPTPALPPITPYESKAVGGLGANGALPSPVVSPKVAANAEPAPDATAGSGMSSGDKEVVGKEVLPLTGQSANGANQPGGEPAPSQSNQTVLNGATVTFSAEASGTPEPTVQWYVQVSGSTGFVPIKGATSKSLTFTATKSQSGNQYRAVFTNPGGSVTTAAATLTVYTPPVITVDPISKAVNAGAKVTFSAAANDVVSVQWYVNNGEGFTPITGATTTVLSFAARHAQDGNQYKAIFTNEGGSTSTEIAMLTVYPPPVVTDQPASKKLNAGMTVTFTANAKGDPEPGVQWFVNSGDGFTEIRGATSRTLTFTAEQAQSGYRYRAVFTNEHGSASTNNATLTVYTPPSIIVQPVSVIVRSGTNATINILPGDGNASPAAKPENGKHHSRKKVTPVTTDE